jgi:hypothetical protein
MILKPYGAHIEIKEILILIYVGAWKNIQICSFLLGLAKNFGRKYGV